MIHHQYSRETHHKAMPSICQLLLARERGAKSDQLETLAQMLSEEQLVGQLKIPESVANIPDSSRSVFAIEFSHDGSLAAVSHTNRTVSLLKVANMKKISEIHQEHDDRSVWTIEFHPSDKNILAMGTLAGRVSVYTSGVLFRTYQHPTTPITSLTFHHLNSYLCFAVENRLYVWDWEADRLINEPLQCADQERIRYVKFNPLNNTLITGITKAPILEFSIYPQRAASFSALHLLHTFLSTVHFMLEQVETFATATSCMDNQESKPHVWNYLIKYLIDHHQRHGHKYVNSPTNVDDYQFWGIDSSLDLFIRRLDTLVATNSTYEFDNHRLEKYMDNIQGVLDFFTTINDQLIEDSQNAGSFVRIRFDERKIDKIVRTMYGLLYTLNREDVIEHDLKFYLDDERLLDKVALSIPTEYKKHFNLQVWDLDVDQQIFPRLTNAWSNIIATCYIHNDSTISLAACGTRIATFKTEIFTKIIEIRSLEEHNLGALIHIFDTSRSFVSLSFSPTSQLLLVGVRAFYHCGTILKMEPGQQKMTIARRLDDSDHQMDINCAKWAPNACDGILVGHRNHCLRYVNFRCKVRSQTLKTK